MEKITSYLTFNVGHELYASNVGNIHNILEYREITKVPNMPSYMAGIINLRGKVLPVIDTRKKLGIEDKSITTETCILVMELLINEKEVMVGAIVDSVTAVISFAESEIMPPPQLGTKVNNEYISGIYNYDESFIMILDVNKVYTSDNVFQNQIET